MGGRVLRTEGDTRAAGRGVGGSGVGGKDGAVRVGEDPRPLVPAPLGPFHALRYRNFRLFFVGQLVSVAGSWMQTVAQQWLVFDLTKSSAWLGIVSGASAIPYVACSTWGGKVADQHPRRTIIVWTQAAM